MSAGNDANAGGDTFSWWAPWLLPVAGEPVRNARVDVAGGIVTAVTADVAPTDDCEQWPDCVIAPGFVNAHSHIEYATYGALADGLPFEGWIDEHIRRKRRLAPEHMLASARLGAIESAAAGITCTGDASFSGDAATALAEAGLRARVYLEVFGMTAEDDELARCLPRIEALPDSPLLQYGISPHAPYTASRRLYELVAETRMHFMTHLAESSAELRLAESGDGPLLATLQARGMQPVALGDHPVNALADLLGPHSVIVHAVHIGHRHARMIARAGAPVVHCPRSNANLACGIMPLELLRDAGVPVALGTDSPASAGPIDMFAEMRAAIALQRAATGDSQSLSARDALRMATVEAARVLDMPGLGIIEPGAPADMLVCRTGPCDDPVAAYVLAGTPADVELVTVAGRAVWHNDSDALRLAREAAREARELLAQPLDSALPLAARSGK